MESIACSFRAEGRGGRAAGRPGAANPGRTAVDGMTVSAVTTTAAFASMEAEWRELLAASNADCLFLTWEWLFSWWQHAAGSRRLMILTVRRAGSLLGIAPFALRAAEPARLHLFPVLEFLGVGPAGSDYLDLILRRGEEQCACAALADYLAQANYQLDLRRVELGCAEVERLVAYLEDNGWHRLLRDDDICLYVSLGGSCWEDYLAGLGRVFRYSLRRARRSAEAEHSVTYVTVRNEEDRLPALRSFVHMHNRRWDERDGSQALPDTAIIRFHEALSGLALKRGWLRLASLRFDDTPVAAIYGFSYGAKLYYYLPAFDPDHAKWAAGRMCLEESLRAAFEEGLDEYDMLHGDERYKYHWAKEFRALGRYQLFPPGLRGNASHGLVNARARFKALLHAAGQSGRLASTGGETAGARPGQSQC